MNYWHFAKIKVLIIFAIGVLAFVFLGLLELFGFEVIANSGYLLLAMLVAIVINLFKAFLEYKNQKNNCKKDR